MKVDWNNITCYMSKNGFLLGYNDDEVIYKRYKVKDNNILDDDNNIIDFKSMNQIHFFNYSCELRIIVNENGELEAFKFHENEEVSDINGFCFYETQLLKDQYITKNNGGEIEVISRFKYDENDSAFLDSYRISCSRKAVLL